MNFSRLKQMYHARQEILGINARNLHMIYTHNRREFFPNVDGKLLCKELMLKNDIPTPTTYGVVSGPRTLQQWEDGLKDIDEFVIKPNRGFGGGGIMIVAKKDGKYTAKGEVVENAEIEFHIRKILNGVFSLDNIADTAFFEKKLNNHPAVQKLIAPDVKGVADVRLICQFDRPVMAMLRLPSKDSGGTANLHQGGIGVGIDVESGITNGGCLGNQHILEHPESKVSYVGHTLPHFDEILKIGSKISRIVRLGYIGIDFILDRDSGPLILEVNARPGLNIQIANLAGLRKRIQWSFE